MIESALHLVSRCMY